MLLSKESCIKISSNIYKTTTKQKQKKKRNRSATSIRPQLGPIQQIVIHWFRNHDLRLHDNQSLFHSSQLAYNHDCHILPVYIFDKKLYGNQNRTKLTNSLQYGIRRTKFIIESVIDLRYQLQKECQTQLLVGYDTPTNFFRTLLTDLKQYYKQRHQEKINSRTVDNDGIPNDNQQEQEEESDIIENDTTEDSNQELLFDIHIICQDEPVRDERIQVYNVNHILQQYNDIVIDLNNGMYKVKNHETKYNKTITQIWGSTLFLPKHFKNIKDDTFRTIPNLFTTFTHQIRHDKIQDPIPIPPYMLFPNGLYTSTSTISTDSNTTINPLTYMPSLHDLGYTQDQVDMVTVQKDHSLSKLRNIKGGETMALQRMKTYIWDKDLLRDWSKMRSLPFIQNKSTLLSPYLAHGCISPRTIANEVKQYYKGRKAPEAMVILQHELRMRDYNKFYCVKHGDGIFHKFGAVQRNKRETKPKFYLRNENDFTIWKEGRTGYPLVDAAMREMTITGYTSNKCRLFAASFLIYDMQHDWRRGAEYYEEQCIDYDVYINWWAWCNIAGFTSGRTFPRSVIAFEGYKYDPNGFYVKQWVPELRNVPKEYIHEPWKMTTEQQVTYKVQLGVDYPNPIVDPLLGEERRKLRAEKRDQIRKLKFIAFRTRSIPKGLKRYKSWQLDKIRAEIKQK